MASPATDTHPAPPSSDEKLGPAPAAVEHEREREREHELDDEFHTTRWDYDEDTMKELQVPTHPIASMQGAFAESMLDASNASTPTAPKSADGNAATRRKKLLDQEIEEDTHASKWQQKPGQRYHELWKLMAQISFGIYLLLNGIAKDDEQVLTILQGHVDQVDAFLESTLEDFDLAIEDIEERLKFLKMPLDNINIFDAMLEDRQFRLQIVTGNERIEHIIHRTASAMNDALRDVKQGLDATKEFAIYLAEEQEDADWRDERPEMQKVYDAMKGNAEGWWKAFISLQTKGNHLGQILVQLGSIVAEMDKRAGQVSRNTRFSITPGSAPSPSGASRGNSPIQRTSLHQSKSSVATASHRSRPSMASVTNSITKDLPKDPSHITPAIQATLPAFQYVSDRERVPEPLPETAEHESEPEMEAEVFKLEPRTYSPVPSSSPGRRPIPDSAEPPPHIRIVAPSRSRFSLKRKQAPQKLIVGSSSASLPSLSKPSTPQTAVAETRSSLPNRGLPDSAYGSDTDRKVSHGNTTPGYLESHRSGSYQDRPPSRSPRSIASQDPHQRNNGYVTSPRSEQFNFHPVRASPNSPLQRPWTAAPTNLRSQTSMSTPLSTMSQTSSSTTDPITGSKNVKKKKSGFGWLKKAFTLSEEEKQAFEEKRRAPAPNGYAVPLDQRPQFLDGRRLR